MFSVAAGLLLAAFPSRRVGGPLKMHAIQLAYFARPGTSSDIFAARRDIVTAVSTVAGAFDARRQWLWIQIVDHVTTGR